MITRSIYTEAKRTLGQFRALCITGPRQSGKTTLSKLLFPDRPYVNFENPETQYEAEINPQTFIGKYKDGAIFDEVQRVPHIFRYLQLILDENTQRGQFILTGSNNFLLQEQVSQSLAGRAGYLSLLPLSFGELKNDRLHSKNILHHILKGGYPEIWSEKLDAGMWHRSYFQTYVQRDVRLIRNISNLAVFNRFVSLCATHAGQILNRDELAKNTGIDSKTAQAWLGLLEHSYILFQLQPWYNNMNKRIVKSPKIYFYDTGLLCYLLGIKNETGLQQSPTYGALFENWIISEIVKNRSNAGLIGGIYYFRDSAGNEIDVILEKEGEPMALEIKSGVRLHTDKNPSLNYWHKLNPSQKGILIHGGEISELLSEQLSLLSWSEVDGL